MRRASVTRRISLLRQSATRSLAILVPKTPLRAAATTTADEYRIGRNLPQRASRITLCRKCSRGAPIPERVSISHSHVLPLRGGHMIAYLIGGDAGGAV